MIVSSNIHPSKNLYSLGGEILKLINKSEKALDLLILYDDIKSDHNLSFSLFLYALDWLFILNLINVTENGEVKKCF